MNPLLKRQKVTSHQPPDTGYVEPVPESYVGDNNPYRGIESHGVPPNVVPMEYADAYTDEPDEEYLPPIPEEDPVPVRIVQTRGREIRKTRMWRLISGKNTETPRMVVSYEETRRRVKVMNVGTATIYIGESPDTANAMNGWPLAVNASEEFQTQTALFAFSSDATEQPVACTADYSVEL